MVGRLVVVCPSPRMTNRLWKMHVHCSDHVSI